MRRIARWLSASVVLATAASSVASPPQAPMQDGPPGRTQATAALEDTSPPRAPVSRLYLPVRIPMASIRDRLNREVPLVMRGRERDPVRHRAVIGDTLDWFARRGPIQVGGQRGQLRLDAVATGSARVTGRVRALRGVAGSILRGATGGASDVPFSVDGEAIAAISATLAPKLRSDWRIEPNARARIEVYRAEVPIAGVATVSVRRRVRDALQHRVTDMLGAMEHAALQDDRLRGLAQREWNRLHKVEKLGEEPDTWLIVRPLGIAARQIGISADAVELGIMIDAETHIAFGEQAPQNPVQPLPPLVVTEDADGRFALNTRAIIPWSELSAAIAQRLTDHRFQGGGGMLLQVRQVELMPQDQQLLLTLDLEIRPGPGYPSQTVGRLHVTATPRLDAAAQTLYFDGLDYQLETKDGLVAAADGLLHAAALGTLGQHASIDLSPHLAWARAEASTAIERFVAQVPDGIRLSAVLKDIAISDLATTPEGLQVVLETRADLSAAITRLDL